MSSHGIAFIDHCITHCHSSRTCACNGEHFIMITGQQHIQHGRTSKNGTEPHLVSSAEHNTFALPDPFKVGRVYNILAVADMHHTHICTTDPAKSIEVIVPDLIRDHRGRCNDFYADRWSAGFFHETTKNTEFKKIKITAVYLSFFQVR